MESRKHNLELTLTAVVLWTGSAGGVFAGENQPPRLRRADCFLGAHFDFHAQMDDSRLGETTTEKMVNAIIDTFHPDYIEIDTKGHPGVSSYPTRIGNHANNFVGDPLRVWREVIEYLRTENHVLKEKHGGKRILLNVGQRRRLAVKGKILGRK